MRKGPKPLPPESRFWRQVRVVNDWGSCWEWRGGKSGLGYGSFRVSRDRKQLAHRFAYESSVGPIPEGMVVMHTCDNRGCVRPTHLKVGTQAENIADRDAKGRHWAPCKLSDEAVAQIRAWATYEFSQREIARWFGVCAPHVSRLVRHETRRTVPSRWDQA